MRRYRQRFTLDIIEHPRRSGTASAYHCTRHTSGQFRSISPSIPETCRVCYNRPHNNITALAWGVAQKSRIQPRVVASSPAIFLCTSRRLPTSCISNANATNVTSLPPEHCFHSPCFHPLSPSGPWIDQHLPHRPNCRYRCLTFTQSSTTANTSSTCECRCLGAEHRVAPSLAATPAPNILVPITHHSC